MIKTLINLIKRLLKNKMKGYYEGSKKSIDYPEGSMSDAIIRAYKKYPNNTALEYYGTIFTYKDFVNLVKKVARSLKAYGIEKDDRVTICMPNTPEGLAMVYATNMVGGVANMLHPLSSEKEIEYSLNLTKSKFILTIDISLEKVLTIKDNTKVKNIIVATAAESMQPLMSKLYWLKAGRKVKYPVDEHVIKWSKFLSVGVRYDDEINEPRQSTDPAVILYSGGTTGVPKGIVLSNLSFNALALQCHEMIRQSVPGASVLTIMPLFHGFGLGVCIHTPLSLGMSSILLPTFNGKKFGQLIKKYQPTFIAGVPTLYEALLKAHLGKNVLKCVKSAICGGDTLTEKLQREVNDYLQEHGSTAKIRQGYGLTEGTGACCLTPEDCIHEDCIGEPLPDMNFKIIRVGTYEEADELEEGEICINGPTVMLGYYDNKEETESTLIEHEDGKKWLHTGDIGYKDEQGLIFFKGRLKRMIISSGYNIYPVQIEKIINTHPAVKTSAVVGVPHPYKGQIARAYVVLKEGVEKQYRIEKEIMELCRKNISKFALPKSIEFRESLPTTKLGKIAFKELENDSVSKYKKNKN